MIDAFFNLPAYLIRAFRKFNILYSFSQSWLLLTVFVKYPKKEMY